MTRDQIFGVGVGAVLLFMGIGSVFFDSDDRDFEWDDDDKWATEFDGEETDGVVTIEVGEGDEIAVKSHDGNTVVYTEHGRIKCQGREAIIIKRSDGSETRIEC